MTQTIDTVAMIGSTTRNGLYQISDTAHRSWFDGRPGQLRVTVREMMGERTLSPAALRGMRNLARRAVRGATATELMRVWYSGGQSHATFIVTGDPFDGWTMAGVGCHWTRETRVGETARLSTYAAGAEHGYVLRIGDRDETRHPDLADALDAFDRVDAGLVGIM